MPTDLSLRLVLQNRAVSTVFVFLQIHSINELRLLDRERERDGGLQVSTRHQLTQGFYNEVIPEQGSLEENRHGHQMALSVSLHLLAPAQDLTLMVADFPSFAPLQRDSHRFLTEPPWVCSLSWGCHRHFQTAGLPGFYFHLSGCRAGLLSKLLKAPELGLEGNSHTHDIINDSKR